MTAVQQKQPPGLYVLFFAEMWERFSFYGMRALLVFYLTKHWLFDDRMATGLYATYGSLVYLTPVIGGLLADRILGFRKAVIFGGILLVLGHFGMAFEGEAAHLVDGEVVRDELALQFFYLSLALIIVGVGFLKPNISSIVGELYEPNDARRDAGFTLFYMGINLGAMVSALVCGYLGETYGWRYGFGLAGVGMLVGLITFVRGKRLLLGAGEPPQSTLPGERKFIGLSPTTLTYVLSGAGIAAAWWLMQHHAVVGGLLGLGAAVSITGIIAFSLLHCTPFERNRMLLVLFLTAVSVLFWALFEQAGSSMSLFADRVVDRQIGGTTIAASQLQSINPAFIILLAPFFARLWVTLAGRGKEPSTSMKFALALLQVGAGFVALVIGIQHVSEQGSVGLFWLILAYFLHTTGELCLSPVGLSMVTRLSVPRVVGLMMGVWFLASSGAHYVGGILAGLASTTSTAGEESLSLYQDTFMLAGQWGIAAGLVLLVISPWLTRLAGQDASDLPADGGSTR
jgi:proton-dependent oligopeptide transporter, POT family